jgi:cobalt-zinc-cadmium resistance protein CzcA
MISRIIEISIRRRWFVVLAALALCALGAWALPRIPIDAVPDITNNQVQINTVALALSPVEIEKQVTFRIETALAGTPGLEYTRSLSRNGFSQVTAVFSDKTNIYFARQQINERLLESAAAFRPAPSQGSDRSPPGSARSTCGLSSMRRAPVPGGGTESPAGRAMAPISPRRDNG